MSQIQLASVDSRETQATTEDSQPGEINAELVRQVADRVYRMLLRDLKYAQERQRPIYRKPSTRKGGR